uniref:Uncharacterized protein n=1 Tax=Anopheles culicifacies TaxID=139723 RepID=A0A182MI72_9DIPT
MVVILIVLPGTCHQHSQPWPQPQPQPATASSPSRHQQTKQPPPPPPTDFHYHQVRIGSSRKGTVPSPATNHRGAGANPRTRTTHTGATHRRRAVPSGGRVRNRPARSDPLIDANNNHPATPDGHEPSGLRYLSRVIISDDFSQVEVKTAPDNAEVEAINREEEIIKKRKTELTTTRQIETRVKRQLLFEDGKVVEDSGPIVSTNTTEDTDKQETVQTEHRTLGDPEAVEAVESGNRLAGAGEGSGGDPALPVDSVSSNAPKTTIVPRPPDGLLRNIKEEVVVSREETKERTEVMEQKHFGDFTDDKQKVPSNVRSDKTKDFNAVAKSTVKHKRRTRYLLYGLLRSHCWSIVGPGSVHAMLLCSRWGCARPPMVCPSRSLAYTGGLCLKYRPMSSEIGNHPNGVSKGRCWKLWERFSGSLEVSKY